MGAKTWMLASSNRTPSEILTAGPELDRDATAALAKVLFPSDKLTPLDDGALCDTAPPDDELVIGCFPDLAIVAAREFGLDYPSRLAERFITSVPGRSVYLVAMHSVVDFFGYAIWRDGTLQRSLSVSPDSGVMEDVGSRLPFEEPYWSGEHPAGDPEEEDDEYTLAFDPLELGDAALGALFGYQIEGTLADVEPSDVPLMRFKRSRSWWRLW